MRQIAVFARALLAFAALLPLGAGAQLLTPEIQRGLSWLEAQVRTDRTVIGEEQSIAERLQVRCELRATLLAFSRTHQTMPCVVPPANTTTEILVRTGTNSGPAIPASYWLADGGVAPDVGYGGSSIIDTAWALGAANATSEQLLGAAAFLYSYQFPSGGFGASWSGPETVAATGFIGRQLAQHKKTFTGTQPAQLAAAAAWVLGEAQAPGQWASVYETALAHLFLSLESPDPVRDAATYEYFVANQNANGSWSDDPYLTALVLRAAATRSLPRVNESGVRLRTIDSVTRAPVPGALVNSVNTDANGFVTVFATPATNVSISITKTGYQSRTLNIPVTTGIVTDLGDIELVVAANAILIVGDVVNDLTGQPVSGATIQVFANGSFMTTGTSDAVGHFERSVTGAAGAYRVVVSSSGYLPSVAEFTGVLGTTYQVDVRLRQTAANSDGAFRGTVTDATTGAALANASVSWRGASGATRTAFTLADGTYAMTGLARETGELTFARSPYAGRLVVGVAPSNPETVVSAQMSGTQTTAQIAGFVRDSATGAPLPGARIDIVNFFTGATAAVLTSDAAGQFSVSGLALTTYRWTATLAGYMTLTGQVAAGTTPFVQLNVPLLRAVGGVTGKVVDKASGAAIAGATARIGTSQAQTDAAGVFTLASLDAGLYNLEVTAAGYRTGTFSVSVVSGLQTDIGRAEMVASATANVAEVFGTVKAKVGGAPIAGATVSVVGADPQNATATDAAGAFGLRDIALGTRQIRVVAPGYQPANFTMALTEAIRYRLDADLTAAEANEIVLAAATNASSYGAYAPAQVTTTFTIAAGVPLQTGHLELAVLDASGRIAKLLPEPGNVQSTQVSLHPATPVYTMPFTTGNLAPGVYRVRVSLYDGPVGTASSTRSMLATSEASFTVTATRSIGAVTVIPLPEFTNVGVPTATGYRVEISNKSNVAVDIDLDLRLQGPAGAPVGQVTQRVAIRPDEAFKTLDISAGTITFAPNGVYQAIASVTGVDPPPITARALGVMPATRIEIQQTLQPGTIAPANEKKIRVDIRLKGVQQ